MNDTEMRQILNEWCWFRLSNKVNIILIMIFANSALYSQSSHIGDWVWNDANRNGIQDASEEGISGIELKLYNNDRILIATTTSDSLGRYAFDNVSSGTYYIQIGEHGEYQVTIPFYSNNELNSDIDLLFKRTGYFDVSEGDTIDHIDAGFYLLQNTLEYSSIGDMVWEDLNGNGLQEDSEPGVEGITISLYNGAKEKLSEVVSNSYGQYKFDSLEAGRYYIQLAAHDQYLPTKNVIGSPDHNSDIDQFFLKSGIITIGGGEELNNYDIGLYATSSISGYVWGDDQDCTVEMTEEFLQFVEVYLLDENQKIVDQTITQFDGSYIFDRVLPGIYYISIGASENYEICVFGNEPYNLITYKDQTIIEGINLSSGEDLINIFVGLTPIQKCQWSIELVEMAQPMCGDSTGFILVDVIGSIDDYQVTWSHGGNDILSTDLSAGEYTVSVESGDGCIQELAVSVADIGLCEPVEEVVQLDLRVFLEGVHDGGGQLTSNLRSGGYLPGLIPETIFGRRTEGGHPYQSHPWSYEGYEGIFIEDYEDYYPEETIDWILVSIRENAAKESELFRRAALLLSDGSIIFPDDSAPITLDISKSYYIVVEHRNHLIVMSDVKQSVYQNILTYDFTQQQSYRSLLGHGQKQLEDGTYAMFAGNLDYKEFGRSDLNYGDIAEFVKDNGEHSSYYNADIDMNADVNVKDKKLILDNVGVFSDVPQ